MNGHCINIDFGCKFKVSHELKIELTIPHGGINWITLPKMDSYLKRLLTEVIQRINKTITILQGHSCNDEDNTKQTDAFEELDSSSSFSYIQSTT